MPAPNSSDSDFERTFADLAYARMRDKAPSLLDFLIGFQLIDKNDEETHAVGVFAFKVGGEWVYAPVFFINGELKGYELMYVKSQDAFVPLVEEWVNYILNRRPSLLGKKEDRPRSELPLRQPDFDVFARSPYIGSKWAGQFRPSYNEIVERINPDYCAFMPTFDPDNWPDKHRKYAGLGDRLTVVGALKVLGPQAVVNLMETMKKDARFANALMSVYPLDKLAAASTEAAAKPVSEVSDYDTAVPGTGKKPKKNQKLLTSEEQDAKDREEQLLNELQPIIPLYKGARVILGTEKDRFASRLTDGEREELVRRRFLVKDARDESEKSKIYPTQISASLQSPQENGLYDVVGASGKKRKMLVAPKPLQMEGTRSGENYTLVVDPETKAFGNFHGMDVLTSKQYGSKDWASFLSEDCVDPKTLTPRSKAVIVSPHGLVSPAFEVSSKTGNADGRVEMAVWTCSCPAPASSSAANLRTVRTDAGEAFSDPVEYLSFTDKDSAPGAKQIGRTLFVSKGARALVLCDPPKKDRIGGAVATPQYAQAGPDVGNVSEFWQQLTKDAYAKGSPIRVLRILTDGLEYRAEVSGIQSAPFRKTAMIKHLVEMAGLSGEDAEFLVTEARPRKSERLFLKLAADYQNFGNGDAPRQAYFPDPILGNERGIDASIMYPQTVLQNIGMIDPSNRQIYRDFRYIDEPSKDLAFRAASKGQKEVLDVSVISGLIKTMDIGDAVDGYIGDLLLGLDRIGRILFMFYWHYDKFKERYGSQDMPELEDNLRNVFVNLGELALFLKQKTIEPDQANTAEARLTDVLG